ncbi:glycosyltransferase family 2 protein [Streptomyces sp. I05A-00742]|uniref:glycosyltransferase n=1 Tax=Streptomyces sp. I05A-00742 TaxID=2732853 RepID=UPI001487B5D1|nr:glycosyltransferase family A protein [Streptomyces sp. I05A-00742]
MSGSVGRISYCTTCKNRLWQLSETLPGNLRRVAEAGNSEIVLVNYNSDDELDRWVRRFERHMESGILRYLHQQTEPYFHASKAKNLAHLAATGQYLVNLDADNYIGETIPTWRTLWQERPDLLIHGFSPDKNRPQRSEEEASRIRPDSGNGTYGRIGLPRTRFLALGGYDEHLLPSAHEDQDLMDRAAATGLPIVRSRQPGPAAIRNSHRETMRYSGTGLDWWDARELNKKTSAENLRFGRLTANSDRSPMKALLNFSEETAF